MKDWDKIYDKYLSRLKAKLPDFLTYHDWQHTEYVLSMSITIAKAESMTDDEILLIKTAALFHDYGFIKSNIDHEERGIKYCSKRLPKFGYSDNEIDKIAGLIRATKIPQRPLNNMEAILADADLEYLGTDNFTKIGNKLFAESQHYNPALTIEEWDQIQIKFMQAHQYHTPFCIEQRKEKKLENLKDLIAKQL